MDKNFIFLLRFSEIGDDMSMCELKVISGIVLEIDETSIRRRFVQMISVANHQVVDVM